MKQTTKLKNQLITCKEWARRSRKANTKHLKIDFEILCIQVAIEQLIKYLEMQNEHTR